MAVTKEEFLTSVKHDLGHESRSYTANPALQGIIEGSLTLDQVRGFCRQYYLHVREVLRWIAQAYVNCPFPDVRLAIFQNLVEEELGLYSKTKGHLDLLADFGAALGLSRDDLEKAEPNYETAALIDCLELMSRTQPWYVTVAAIGIGFESQVPQTFGRVAEGLKKHYGLKDQDVLFWSVHVSADEEHGDISEDMVWGQAQTEADRENVRTWIRKTAEHKSRMWSASIRV
jgi:pyrroloquinoline-quinone synthase